MPLSERIRPNVEAARWVCDEVVAMEKENAALKATLREVIEMLPVLQEGKYGFCGMVDGAVLYEFVKKARALLGEKDRSKP